MLTLEDARQELAEYLQNKIDKTNTNNPRYANKGALYYIEDELDPIKTITVAFDIIQLQFQKTASDNLPGECKLTATSTMIGEHILSKSDERSLYDAWERSIKVGDLHIEAFYNLEYIDIYYPPKEEENEIDPEDLEDPLEIYAKKKKGRFIRDDDSRCHIVIPTRKWTDLKDCLLYTSPSPRDS